MYKYKRNIIFSYLNGLHRREELCHICVFPVWNETTSDCISSKIKLPSHPWEY